MLFIVITSPEFIPGEAFFCRQLLDCGVNAIHLRKPDASIDDCARLLDSLPDSCYGRIVMHDHFSLCRDYGLMGVHLNSRHPLPPTDFQPHSISASCHGIAEVERRKPTLDYVFMSPVFDSISKHGYQSAYTPSEMAQAAARGIIDNRVVALGGVTLANIPQLRQWHFGGAAFLGDVWNRAGQDGFEDYVRSLKAELDKVDSVN